MDKLFWVFVLFLWQTVFLKKETLIVPGSSVRVPSLAASRIARTRLRSWPIMRFQETGKSLATAFHLIFPQRKESAFRLSSNGTGIHCCFGHLS